MRVRLAYVWPRGRSDHQQCCVHVPGSGVRVGPQAQSASPVRCCVAVAGFRCWWSGPCSADCAAPRRRSAATAVANAITGRPQWQPTPLFQQQKTTARVAGRATVHGLTAWLICMQTAAVMALAATAAACKSSIEPGRDKPNARCPHPHHWGPTWLLRHAGAACSRCRRDGELW